MIFLDAVRNQTTNRKCFAGFIKKQIKSSSKEYVGNARKVLGNKKRFPKIIS